MICEIRNPGHWNPEYSSRNPKSHQRLKSGIPIPLTKNIEFRIWNQEYTVRNPESKTVLDSGIQEIFACGIQNPGNICLWILESWALKRGIQIKESGNLTTDWNLESSTLNAGSKGWNPESKTVLDSLSRGKVFTLIEF